MSNLHHHIPTEVVTEILCRISPPDARKLRCVSKQWLAIIDNPDIIQRQLRRSTALFLFLEAESGRNLSRVEPASLAPTTPPSPSFMIPKPYPIFISQRSILVGSSRGLLCFCRCRVNRSNLFIVNPTTHESRFASSLWDWVGDAVDWRGCGFGYDQVSGDYKAVFFLNRGYSAGEFVVARIQATTGLCHSRGYRTTDAHDTYVPLGHQKMGVLVGGALHWLAVSWEYYHSQHDQMMMINGPLPSNCVLLIALDLGCGHIVGTSDYKIREIGQPDYYGRDCEKTVGVLDSCLCVVCASYSDNINGLVDIWVMKEYGKEESWCRLCSVVNDPVLAGAGFVLPLGKFRGDGGQILMLVDRSKLVWYDPLKKSAELVPVSGLENYGGGATDLGLKLEALGCLEIPCNIWCA